MKEKWSWIRQYKGYYKVSTKGRVKSVDRIVVTRNVTRIVKGRILPIRLYKTGYCYVVLYKIGMAIKQKVHRLVLETFIGECPPGMQCRHYPDRDPANNNLNNLSWSTPKKNSADRVTHGTLVQGEKHYKAKLTWRKVIKIRKLYAKGKHTKTALSRRFKVSFCIIHDIVEKKTWKVYQDQKGLTMGGT